MKFKLKINPETFTTPDRKEFIVTQIEAYPVGMGTTTAEGVSQLLFLFSFLGENNEIFTTANANISLEVKISETEVYPLLSNLFSIDATLKYEAMCMVATEYGYIALPIAEQV